ncbi:MULTISPECIES: hypothetical protein [unclassified Nocardia]|uniref:hypothetical protein n=1 Tax=unclassified Nocardia TaxID=2637762 RepID=UPI001CE403F6|nr:MULTISPECIES: hypothetical protein [unclassified Nocardia]
MTRHYEPHDPDINFWAATWGLRDSDFGINEQLDGARELVELIVDDIRDRWGNDYDLTIEWTVDGWHADEELAAQGIVLPERA